MTDLQSLPCRRASPCTVSHLSGIEVKGERGWRVLGLGKCSRVKVFISNKADKLGSSHSNGVIFCHWIGAVV